MNNDADDQPGEGAGEEAGVDAPAPRPQGRRRLPSIHLRQRPADVGEEGIASRLAQQWAAMRDERRAPAPAPVTTGTSNFSRAQVPWGLDLAAAWGWRFLVIAAAGYVLLWLVAFFAVVTIPLVIALLVSALVVPVVDGLHRAGLPRGLSALLVVLAGIAFIVAMLTFAGQQVANGAQDLADQSAQGLGEIKDWLRDGPLHASDSQINDYIQRAQDGLENQGKGVDLGSVTEVGTAVGHIF
ncbi:MAG TPA: AI-2E family transporter, partial [Nocardioides sp.]|nr:AI-2E family transporter [Nocardioides sp.]